eukprot:CAMPEP_0119570142 /NCGR_PEP_ID=MMETSP1352-20130426/43463_1 /TAXON_ID=265584 /ORGANISM="Stauroneis constricta, Strain CCMP1120" /LENGTH=390 /DNA_ID=CAMNT_0007619807 /DNA_START=69 /DNA_END=1241 /DNA_ORIENTATION=+
MKLAISTVSKHNIANGTSDRNRNAFEIIQQLCRQGWRNFERQLRDRYTRNDRPLAIGRITVCDFDDKTISSGQKELLMILHRVRVYKNRGVADSDPELRALVQNLLGFFASEGGPRNVNQISVKWALPMLMSTAIDGKWRYVNIRDIESISEDCSTWLTRNVETVQMMFCTFADGGHAFCEGLQHEYACPVTAINLMSVDIDASKLATAIRKSKKLSAFNVQDKRSIVRDEWWSVVIHEGLALNESIESVFISGHYKDLAMLEKDFPALLSCKRHCSFGIFISPTRAPCRAFQRRMAKVILQALKKNRHPIVMNYPGLLIDFEMWKKEIEPFIKVSKELRKVRRALKAMGGKDEDFCAKMQTLLLKTMGPSNHDMLFEVVKMRALLLGAN